MNTRGIFITGTDTGVGKTYVAAGIAAALKKRSIDVGVMKPAETGCRVRNGKLEPSDALTLMKTAAVRDALSLVNPYRFRKPLAPSVAAALEKKQIQIKNIVAAYHQLSKKHKFMIVEGAGGIMVPLSENSTFLDLAKTLGIPALIVARPRLGTINHTLLTIAALKSKGVAIAGIVFNESEHTVWGLAGKTSPEVIERLSGVKLIGNVTYDSTDFDAIIDTLADYVRVDKGKGG